MEKSRLNYRDDFEMLYLRHEYLEKAGKLDSSYVKKYAGIVYTTAKIMFNRLTNFEKVGFTEEDIVSITNIYMLSYMALYSIQTNPAEMQALLQKKGVTGLSDSEIARIDRNRMIAFLRQRLHHCGTVCARKARNITVGIDRRGIFAETNNSFPVSKEMILEDYKKYGYRKATAREYKEALEKAKDNKTNQLTDKNGFKIFKIECLNGGISQEDYRLLAESNRGIFYQSPDVALQIIEDSVSEESFKDKFQKMTKKQRLKALESFVRKNKGNKRLRAEVRLAKDAIVMEDFKVRFEKMTRNEQVQELKNFIESNKKNKELKIEVRLAKKMLFEDNTVV